MTGSRPSRQGLLSTDNGNTAVLPADREEPIGLSREKLLWLYERMRLIREFENQLHTDFAAGKIPGFVHLYAGEEAVAAGVCAQ